MSAAPTHTARATADGLVLALSGGWTVRSGAALERAAAALVKAGQGARTARLDVSGLERLDTAGAWVIDRSRVVLAAAGVAATVVGASPDHALLIAEAGYQAITAPEPRPPRTAVALLASVGESVATSGFDLAKGVSFIGEVVSVVARQALRPRSWRWTATSHHLEMFSLRSAPIILLINFLVGAIVAQQGIFQLTRFGATAFTVDLVGVLVLRELGVLLTSIMIAGRSGSAITAEIGSMMMREEIDALKVMALDPVEVLILPRLLALILALPLLTFLADMAALFGGLCVSWVYGGMAPEVFLTRLQSAIGVNTFAVGLIKAPFMAAVIGVIAAIEGFGVRGSAESLGRQVTESVVKSIFMVIVVDGLFAMFFAAVRYSTPATASADRGAREAVIRVRGLKVGFGDALVMDGLDLDVYRGEVLGFVGASGAGKTVLTRAILGLVPKRAGTIEVYGRDVDALTPNERLGVGERWGVLFQQGALFSSLTVRQNIQAPMREHLGLSQTLMNELAFQKLALVGLPPDAADKFPSELSGGMIKRAALARALALDPDLVFLDEPTSGLDPIGAGEFDELIATLQKTLGLTVFMVTHDLDSLYAICDRVAALGHGRVTAVGPIEDLLRSEDPWLKAYFHGKRGVNREAAFVAARGLSRGGGR